MKQISIMLFIGLIHLTAKSQVTVSGVIKENDSKEVIPYVSIGIFEKNVGVISNESGRFTITIPAALDNDTLSISCLGYHSQKIAIKLLSPEYTFYLEKKDYMLEPITVSPKVVKVKGRENSNGLTIILQRKDPNKSLSGGEMAMLFKNSKKIKLKEVKFFIAQNGYDTLRLRINIYNAKKTNVEDRLYIKSSIITITNKETGWFSLDLTDDVITVNDDYLIALEIVDVVPEIGKFALKGMLKPFGKSYIRDVSFGKWIKKSFVLSLNSTVEMY